MADYKLNDFSARSADKVKPLINKSIKCSDVDLNKALAVLGFGSWYTLESSKYSINVLDMSIYSKSFNGLNFFH